MGRVYRSRWFRAVCGATASNAHSPACQLGRRIEQKTLPDEFFIS